MADAVWQRIDDELERRKQRHLTPSTWSALGRTIGATDQQIHNWKKRQVPSRHHLAIAMAFGWSVDELLGLEPTRLHVAEPPPKPTRDFSDRRLVTPSEWDTLQAVTVMLGEAELEDIRRRYRELHERAKNALAGPEGPSPPR